MTRLLTATVALLFASSAVAQSVVLPLPRLLTTHPMGGQAGTTVDVTITGEHLENVSELFFDRPGFSVAPKLDAAGTPLANVFSVTISGDCPPGLYEARVTSRLGVSSPRVFCVGTLPEVTRSTPNTSLETAMSLPMNTVCNAAVSSRLADHYAFDAVAGHRYVIHCDARNIDSKLDAVLIVADGAGRDLVAERRGESIDFTAPADGRYVIKVHELTFKGGPEHFYRLTLRELRADESLPTFASTTAVNAFSWPPAGLPGEAATAEAEPNAVTTPQSISLPCDISGAFATAADVDTFEFTATKGETWWIEVASERLGRPTDPSIVVQRVVSDGDQLSTVDVAEFTDIPSPVKVSSNGYAYDGPPYNGGSGDINGRLDIPEDGTYRLQMSDLFGGTRSDPRNRWRLIIRKAQPDFAVVAWGLHMELRNGDRNAVSKPLALRGGSTVALEVIAFRRDGFDGPITFAMTGLPDGVVASSLSIPPGKSRGIVLLSADQNAPQSMSRASLTATATVDGLEVVRNCPIAMHAWPIADSWSEIPYPRLTALTPVSVTTSEFAPVSIAAAEEQTWEAVAGSKLTIPVQITKRCEFSGPVLQLRTFGEGFENNPQFEIPLNVDRFDVTLDLATLKVAPGEYQIAFYGSGVAKYRYNPDAVADAEARVHKAEQLLKDATDQLAQVTAIATAASAEALADANSNVAAATNAKQAAEAELASATAALKSASELATPRDTADIVISKPILIRVLPASP